MAASENMPGCRPWQSCFATDIQYSVHYLKVNDYDAKLIVCLKKKKKIWEKMINSTPLATPKLHQHL